MQRTAVNITNEFGFVGEQMIAVMVALVGFFSADVSCVCMIDI